MADVAIGSDAKARIARLGFEEGLAVLVFGLYFLFDGLISWIGSNMPRDTIRFDIFNIQWLQVTVIVALAIGMKRAKARVVAPRIGYAKPRRAKRYYIAATFLPLAILPLLFGRGEEVHDAMLRFAPVLIASLFAAMYIAMGVQGKVPRVTWLGVAIALIGAWAYWAHASYPVLRMAMGSTATIAGALQLRDFLGTHRLAELEHA